jgi:hypothetical protein
VLFPWSYILYIDALAAHHVGAVRSTPSGMLGCVPQGHLPLSSWPHVHFTRQAPSRPESCHLAAELSAGWEGGCKPPVGSGEVPSLRGWPGCVEVVGTTACQPQLP